MIPVATKNVYGDNLQPESSIVPELLQVGHFLENSLRQAGVEMRPFAGWAGEKPVAAVFYDCPRQDDPDLRLCLEHRIPFLLVISENLHLQPHPSYPYVKAIASRVLTYALDEVDDQKVFWLPYGLDMEKGRRFRKNLPVGDRPYLLGMINSWKKSGMPGDLYERRNQLAIEAGRILGERMFLAGPGWDSPLVFPAKWQRSLAKRLPSLTRWMFGWPNGAYQGICLGTTKPPAFARCEFALAPENCSSLRGYITEKIFNALFAGCIPIYQGHPDAVRWLPPEMFIPMERFRTGREMVCFLLALTPREKDSYRQAGALFLGGENSRPFDLSSYVETFQTHLAAILPGVLPGKARARPAASFARSSPSMRGRSS